MDDHFEKLSIFKDPDKTMEILTPYIRSILGSDKNIQKLSISVLQDYLDERSFNFTILYGLELETSEKKIQNLDLVASLSWPISNEYGYLVGKMISDNMPKNEKVIVPVYYGYMKEHNLALREYTPGKRLAALITEEKKIRTQHVDLLMSWLSKFQQIKPAIAVDPAIDLNDLEINLEILRQRKSSDVDLLDKRYHEIRDLIVKWSAEYNDILVHGDFNPANIIFNNDGLAVIDFESAHYGDRVMDIANLSAYFSMLQKESGVNEQEINETENNLISTYGNYAEKLSEEEIRRFHIYVKYFTLLFKAYELVWK